MRRRHLLTAGLSGLVAMLPGSPARAASAHPSGPRLPAGYGEVDPRTSLRVPLTQNLRVGAPLYPGDPEFAVDSAFTDTRTPGHDDGGYLLEHVTSMGTHSGSHISAPVHFILDGHRLDELDESFSLMPLAVVDVRDRISRNGADFLVTADDLRQWERRHGRIPSLGCVLLLTGLAELYDVGSGETSPYVTTPAPGLSGAAVDWLFAERAVLATGSDSLGPDATSDPTLQATTRTLLHGGITLENVGTGLARMRAHGDWIGVNGNRPAFSGFPMGFTGFTTRR